MRKVNTMQNKLGHNNPPKTFLLSDGSQETLDVHGRIKLGNKLINKLIRKTKPDKNGDAQYVETIFNDTEKVGLKLKINPGGTKTFFFQTWSKDKGRPVKYTLGQYPEIKVEKARQLVDKLKEGVKLGSDPRSIIEAERLIPTLTEVIDAWKRDVMKVSNSYRESTKEDIENRFRCWIYLKPKDQDLEKFILFNRADLNIGNKQIHKILKTDVLKWHKIVSDRGKYQANRIIDDLKVVVNWAMQKETWKIKSNFAKLTKDERNTESTRLDNNDPYTREEFRRIRKVVMAKAFLKKTKFRFKELYAKNFVALMAVLFIGLQGRRYRSEILSVPWSRVEIDRIILDRSKNKNKRHYYSLNKQTQWILRKLKEYGRYKFKTENQIRFKKYVFPAMRKAKQGHAFNIDKTWRTVLREAKVRYLPVYMLRHSWGSNGLDATGDIKLIKDEGGWSSWKMVETYAQHSAKKRSKTSQRVASYLTTAKQ